MEWVQVQGRKKKALFSKEKAMFFQKKLHIDLLAETLLSEQCAQLFMDGWRFVRVFRPQDFDQLPQTENYVTIDIENEWGDRILFRKN